jgi:NAD(P)-dependent dehydrogenase (short-subunit alcohol dehydrogenase family)
MATDWGTAGLPTFTETSHAQIHPSIDPTSLTLPQPFVVCIVGASRGIGAGVAQAYTKAFATGLVLASRRVSGLEETASACKEINPNIDVEIVECDITSAASVAALAEKTKARFGRLDAVVVNSGLSGPVVLKLTDTDPATFQQTIDVNYVGLFHCAKFLIPVLLASDNGAKNFIAVSSFASLIVRGPIANAQYCVSKLAQLKLMEHVHEQYREEGLLSWSVHPGAVDSEMARETCPEVFRPFLTDSAELCGAFCTWLTNKGEEGDWLCGRLLSAKYDVGQLEARKGEIVERDLLKLRMSL